MGKIKLPDQSSGAAEENEGASKAPPLSDMLREMSKTVEKDLRPKKGAIGDAPTFRKLSEAPADSGVREWLTTGLWLLDTQVIGRPGIPIGRMTSLWGKPSTGKTTLLAHLIAQMLKLGGGVILVDNEIKWDAERAQRIGDRVGVQMNDILLSSRLTLEQVFAALIRVASMAIKCGAPYPMLFILDSLSGTQTNRDLGMDDEKGTGQPGEAARIVSKYCQRVIPLLDAARIALVTTSHPKVDLQSVSAWGPPRETMRAERPILHHSSIILRTDFAGKYTDDDKVVRGILSRIRCTGSKIGPPSRSCVLPCLDFDGYHEEGTLFQMALEAGLIETKLRYPQGKIGRGSGVIYVARPGQGESEWVSKSEWLSAVQTDEALRGEIRSGIIVGDSNEQGEDTSG